MSWFSKLTQEPETPIVRSKAEPSAPPEPEADDLGPLIDAAEADALARLPALMDEARKAHADDAAAYSFECKRWGDFLSLFIRRIGRNWMENEASAKQFATSVNLSQVRDIRLVEGHAVDQNGVLEYGCKIVVGSGYSFVTHPLPKRARKGERYEVAPLLPGIEPGGAMFELREKGGARSLAYCEIDDDAPLRETKGFLRPASDDRVVFSGIDATVLAPFGRGQEVLDAILAEIERGAPPADLPPRVPA